MTILLQTRASRVSDLLTTRDVNEIADTEPGAVQSAVTLEPKSEKREEEEKPPVPKQQALQMSYASVGRDGKVEFEKKEKFA